MTCPQCPHEPHVGYCPSCRCYSWAPRDDGQGDLFDQPDDDKEDDDWVEELIDPITFTMFNLRPDTTLREAQAWLRDNVDDGVTCPLCGQFAKVYRRKINAGIARVLIAMYRKAGDDWVYLPYIDSTGREPIHVSRSGEMCIARYWGLIEQMPGEREDGSSRVGWWRLTGRGCAFVRNEIRIPKYARIYASRCLNLDAEQTVTIVDALGTKFNYWELMAGI